MAQDISPGTWAVRAVFFGLLGACLYLMMINVTLARLELLSGMRPFDMRPAGYSPREADALLDALGALGRRFYLTRQIPLDMIYPAVMALTLISTLKWLGACGCKRWLIRAGIWASIGAALADYAENAGIGLMILTWPDTPDGLVHAASLASITKAGLTTAAVLSVLGTVAHWALTRWHRAPGT